MNTRYRYAKCLAEGFYILCAIVFSISLLFANAYFNLFAILILVSIIILKNRFAFVRRKNTDPDTRYVIDCETIICIDLCFTAFCIVSSIVFIVIESVNHNTSDLKSYLLPLISLIFVNLQNSPKLIWEMIKKEWKFIVIYIVHLFIMILSIVFELLYMFSMSKYPYKPFVLAVYISIALLICNIVLMVAKPIRRILSHQKFSLMLLTDGIIRLMYVLILVLFLNFSCIVLALLMSALALLGAAISWKKTAKTGDGSLC